MDKYIWFCFHLLLVNDDFKYKPYIIQYMNYYYQKYAKYKAKYIDLKKNIDDSIMIGGAKYDFFFVHATKSFSSLISMLDQGYLYPGKYVNKKHRFMSGPETESDYIYMSMYFKDIDNMKEIRAISLILDSKLIYDYDVIFHEGWYYVVVVILFIYIKMTLKMSLTKK